MSITSPVTKIGRSRRERARPADGAPRFHTAEEIATRLGCSLSTVWRRIREKKLRVVRDGRLVRIAATDFDAYIRAAREGR